MPERQDGYVQDERYFAIEHRDVRRKAYLRIRSRLTLHCANLKEAAPALPCARGREGATFAPSYMGAWSKDARVLIPVSWFYEFDSRVRPQMPYAVFPLHAPFWLLCGLASWFTAADGLKKLSISIITVEPNEVLKSVGHHRSPAILRSPDEAAYWLRAPKPEALDLLRPFPEENMGVEEVPMGIKIPGNENISLPVCLDRGNKGV